MATPRVLRFDVEGRPLEFSVWLLRARRLLESQVQAHETLWAHASGDLPEPADPAPLAADPTPADSDRYALERADVTAWKSRDAVACIALSSLLLESEETHFTQVLTPTTALLALLPPPMAITINFIATSLPYRLASVRDALLLKHPSELTIEVLESALKDVESNLRSVASAFGVVPPPLFHGCTLPQLPTFTASLATATTDVTAAAVTTSSRSRGRSGKRGGQGAGGGSGGGGGDVASGDGGSAGAGGAPRAAARDSPAAAGGGDAQARQPPTGLPAAGGGAAAWYLTRRQQQQQQPLPSQQPQQQQRQQQVSGQGSRQCQLQHGVVHPPCTYHVLTGAHHSQPCGRSHPPGQCFAQLTDMVRLAYGVDGPALDWLPLVQTYGPDLWGMSTSQLVDLLGNPHAMYAAVDSSASDSVYTSVVSLGASLAEVPVAGVGTCVDTSPGVAPEDASLSFNLDSGASHDFFRDHTTLTTLPMPFSVALANPTSGPLTARYTTTLPCLAVPSGSLTGFHVPSFSSNLVGVRPLVSQHVGVWIEPSGETAVCVDGDTYAPLATFTTKPGSSLYTLHTGPRGQQQQQQQQQRHQQLLPPTHVTIPRQVPASHQVAASPQVAVSGQVLVFGPVAASCSCRSLAHPTVLWHHRMGHPSISRLRAISSQRLVLGLPRVLPSLPPSLVPPCGPCVEGRLHATPHSSSLRPATEPFETLHLDVWGPASRLGLERESFFHVVVDNYSRYTTVFPLAKKSDVNSTLIWWLLTTADTRGRRVSCLHSNRGESPQQNGVAERRIGLVMEIARTSMTHARCESTTAYASYPHTRAPHFLWPYAVWYAANQLNLWPHISRPEVSPTSLWTGSPCAESRIHVWGRLALVCDTSADKISPRAVPCVFLGFPEDSSDYTFYHPPLHRFVDSRDIRFDESVPYYVRYPCRGLPPTVDPTGAGFRGEDPGGASSRGAGVGAESIPVRGPGSGGAGVGAEPVSARESSLRGAGVSGAGVSGAVPGSATTGGAPSAGPGEPGTDPVTFGGAGCGGGATGSLESGPRATTAPGSTPPTHPYPTRHQARLRRTREEQLELEREERELERQQLELQQLEEQQQQSEQEQPQQQQPPPPPVSSLRTLGLPSPSPPSPPSPPVSGPPLPPPDPSPAVFPPPLPPLSPPLSHTWSSRRSPRARPSSPVPFTHLRTALFCSSPPRLSPSVLPSPPDSALTASLSTPITNYYRTYRPVLSLALASLVTDPRASLSSVSALIAEVTEFASTHCLDYATSLVAALPTNPLAVGGEFSLGCDALEDKQFELEFLAAASPHLCAMLLAPEGDPDALDIPTPRTYAEAVVKWPLGSPPVFKARYLARGFSQREGVDFFQTFAPTSKMTTLWVLLHVAAQSDYELHSLDFSTAFLQGSLHEEWRLRRPVYGLRQAPREWHDTLRSTISDLGFQPSSADPSLFVRHGSTPFFVLVYIDDLVFATADKVDLADVKLEQQKRHSCTDLGELRHYLGLQITKDRATRTITLSQSHMVQQVLQRFELQHSNVQRTPLAVDHKLTGPFPDEPFEPSGPYAELVGCLIAEAEIYAGAMVAQELRWMTFLHTDLSEWPSSAPTLFTDNKATILLCQDPRLESEVKYINGR
ncbi:unnamed protein product [Closterium sp. NIES-53]